MDAEESRGKEDDTNRRDAAAGVLAVGAFVVVTPGQTLGRLLDGDERPDPFNDTGAPGRIGSAHLESVEAATVDLERLDAEHGGGRAYGPATVLIRRVNGWLRDGSYPSQVGEGLRHALGKLQSWAGWFAFDIGDQRAARGHWHQSLLAARVLDDKPLKVDALMQMSLLSKRLGRGRDAVDLARAAQRSAAGWATPRRTALLHLRVARGHAVTPDLGGLRRELASAYHFFDKGPHEDDPPWFGNFFTETGFAGFEAICYEDLGVLDRAVALYRDVHDRADPGRQRKSAYYTVRLGQALLRQGDATGAGEIGIEALPLVSAIRSGRIGHRLAVLRSGLAPHRSSPQAGEFIDRYDHAFAGPPD